MRKKPLPQEPLVDDPASIIASALRKKFSHRVFQDSPGATFAFCFSIDLYATIM